MARRSQRLSSTPKGTPNTSHKRSASNTAASSVQAKRPKTQKTTPRKSKYFAKKTAPESTDHDDEEDDFEESSESEEEEEAASEFGDESEESASSGEEPDDSEDESDAPPKSRKTAKPSKGAASSPAIRTKAGNELWREGVKTGLGPGTQVVIKKPKARPAGNTPYREEGIHPNTLLFLKDLKANNERQWLKSNDAEFRQAERDWYAFVEKLTDRLIEIDDTVPELPVKDVIFRIYRDVRFTSDPTPYKPHFSAAFSRTGRKGPYAHYYVQIAPNNESFLGGGLWHPDAAPTAAMRQDIDRNPRRLKDVLMNEGLRKELLRGAPKTEKKAVEAFVSSNSANALKTKPKGYDGDHPEIGLLRLRNYTIGRTLAEEEVLGANFLDRIATLLTNMKPFITYLNSVVMPDEDENEGDEGESEEGSTEEEDEEESD